MQHTNVFALDSRLQSLDIGYQFYVEEVCVRNQYVVNGYINTNT